MKNLKDPKTKIFPSKMREGKELASSSVLDSPSIMSKLATAPHAINFDMSQVIEYATSTMDNAYDDASTLLDNDDVPLGEFLDEQIARVIQHGVVESDDELETETPETPARTSLPRYELPKVPEGYVMSEETTRDILACKEVSSSFFIHNVTLGYNRQFISSNFILSSPSKLFIKKFT